MAPIKLLLDSSTCPHPAVVPNSVSLLLKKAPSGRLFYSSILCCAAALALALSWVHPNHYPPWIVFENEMLAFAGVGIAAFARYSFGGELIRVGNYARLLCILLIVVLVQYGIGMITWQDCALGVLYTVSFAVSVALGHVAWRGCASHRVVFEDFVLLLALFTILLSSAAVLVQWLNVESHYQLWVAASGDFRPFGNLGQPNNQGTLLVIGVLLVDILYRRRVFSAAVSSANLVVLLPAIVATGSRTALLSSVLASVYLTCIKRHRHMQFTLGWLLALLGLYIANPWLSSQFGSNQEMRLTENISSSPRLLIYKQLLMAISENPWSGYGWMQTAYAQSLVSAHIPGGYEVNYAHNFVLDWIVWFGVPIGLLTIAIAIFFFLRNWRMAAFQYKLAHVLLLPVIVHSMLEFPYAYAFFLFPFGMLLGYLSPKECVRDTATRLRNCLENGLLCLLFFLSSIFGILVAVDYMRLAEDFRVIRFENRKVGTVPDGFEMTSPWILTDVRDVFDVFRYTPREGESLDRIAQIQQLAMQERFPLIHVKLISVYVLNNRLKDAEFEFNRFRNLYGLSVVKWGQGLLKDAYCPGDTKNKPNANACHFLSSP